MKIYVKFDINALSKKVLHEQLSKLGISFEQLAFSELELKSQLSAADYKALNAALANYGIEIVEDQKSTLVQKTKDTIIEMVYFNEKLSTSKVSSYLSEKLNHKYGYLSNLFSEVTYSSIENFIIMQKIERVKDLMVNEKLTLTEISYRLNYSSVAHLSTQFKKTTGLTPSAFQRIIARRQEQPLEMAG